MRILLILHKSRLIRRRNEISTSSLSWFYVPILDAWHSGVDTRRFAFVIAIQLEPEAFKLQAM